MKRRDIIIIASVLAVALLAVAVNRYFFRGGGGEQDVVDIRVDGQLYQRLPLDEDTVIEVKQDSGAVNHIEVKDGAAFMRDSTCSNQNCVHMGSISAEDPMLGVIVCLPNRVSVELHLADKVSK